MSSELHPCPVHDEFLPTIVLIFGDECPARLVDLCECACAVDSLVTVRHDVSTLEIGFGTVTRARREAERAAELRFSTPSNAWQEYTASAHDEFLPALGGHGDVFSPADLLLLLEGAVAHLHSADAADALQAARLGSLLHADEPLFGTLRRLGLVNEVIRPHAPHARAELWHAYGLRLWPMLSDAPDAARGEGAPAANCLDAVCAYYGSSVALYFAWLQHTLCWYAPVGLSGVAVWLYHRACAVRIELSTAAPVFSVCAIVWAAAMHRCWRRRAARLALRWGTFEHGSAAHAEPARPGFRGVPRTSPVTGLAEDYFAPIHRCAAVGASPTLARLAAPAASRHRPRSPASHLARSSAARAPRARIAHRATGCRATPCQSARRRPCWHSPPRRWRCRSACRASSSRTARLARSPRCARSPRRAGRSTRRAARCAAGCRRWATSPSCG
jgi:hypothetical protein